MAAGMDAQDMEAKLVRDVEKAEAALLAEKDAANKAELRLIRQEAKEELNIFRRQQVAGGEIPSRLPTLCELDKALDVSLQMRLACAVVHLVACQQWQRSAYCTACWARKHHEPSADHQGALGSRGHCWFHHARS